jgi:hypothetical protein
MIYSDAEIELPICRMWSVNNEFSRSIISICTPILLQSISGLWLCHTVLQNTEIYLYISTSIGLYVNLPKLVLLLETVLKDICRTVPYTFPCGSDDHLLTPWP